MTIGAIIVLYNPNIQLINEALKNLLPQVDCAYIIDNSETDYYNYIIKSDKIKYKPLYQNIGIAAAQNIGIKYFIEQKFDFILFSDQDSVSPNGLVKKLYDTYLHLKDKINISAIGPMPINRKSGKPYLNKQYIITKEKNEEYEYYKMHSIISSYSLIPIKNFNTVGLMEEHLFIDFVDQEWCWRAHYFNNMTCILVPDITITHELGISKKFLGKRISISSPFRIYFQTRNLLWLRKRDYVPLYWKKTNIKKLIYKIIYYSLFSNKRKAYIKNIFNGILDGLTQK